MADVVVTVPAKVWPEWLAEGCLPDESPAAGEQYFFWLGNRKPTRCEPGDRVYVAWGGLVRGYAPLVETQYHTAQRRYCLVREGGAVAVSPQCPACAGVGSVTTVRVLGSQRFEADGVPCAACLGLGFLRVPGFRGFRYRWWDVQDEAPFPDWMTLERKS